MGFSVAMLASNVLVYLMKFSPVSGKDKDLEGVMEGTKSRKEYIDKIKRKFDKQCEANNLRELYLLNREIRTLTIICNRDRKKIEAKKRESARRALPSLTNERRSTAKRAASFLLEGDEKNGDKEGGSGPGRDDGARKSDDEDEDDHLSSRFKDNSSRLVDCRATRKILALRIEKQEALDEENEENAAKNGVKEVRACEPRLLHIDAYRRYFRA